MTSTVMTSERYAVGIGIIRIGEKNSAFMVLDYHSILFQVVTIYLLADFILRGLHDQLYLDNFNLWGFLLSEFG